MLYTHYLYTELYLYYLFLHLTAIEPWLVFSNRYYLRELSTDGQYYNLLYMGLHNVVALDFDIKENRLYFVDVQARRIQRIYMNGTGVETVVWQGIPGAEGIAVDWIGR